MPTSLETYLEKGDGAAGVLAHARLLLRLERQFASVVPSGLGDAARVANYKSGKIVIHAENGAVATKLRQMSQRLCGELSRSGVECNVMEVKVQPRQIPYQSTGSTQKPLSAKACGTLRDTAESLPEGPLRAALATLLRRAARRE